MHLCPLEIPGLCGAYFLITLLRGSRGSWCKCGQLPSHFLMLQKSLEQEDLDYILPNPTLHVCFSTQFWFISVETPLFMQRAAGRRFELLAFAECAWAQLDFLRTHDKP